MLSILKCGRSIVGRQGVTNVCYGERLFNTTAARKPMVNSGYIFLRRIPNQLGKVRGLFRQTGSIALGYVTKTNPKSDKIVGTWMLTCSGMVLAAVILGGVTRLSESGLSMVTWKLLGEKMPTSESDWVAEFELYKRYPEFKLMNRNMTLEEFKRIWWMEYVHRTWGRLIGAAFIVPAVYFWSKGMLRPTMKGRVLALGSLIGIQGLMGWYMVQSGLEDRFQGPADVPRVSQYRLAAHLGLALILYSGLLYNALDHLLSAKKVSIDYFSAAVINTRQIKSLRRFRWVIYSSKGLVFLTALSGAIVAGLDAGLIYNTFPRMGEKWIPDDILALSPPLRNITENPTTAQFDHRLMGYLTLTLLTVMGVASRKHKLPGRCKTVIKILITAAYLQVGLGITTLLLHVPMNLATMHQSGSLLLLSAATWLCHEAKHLKKLPK
ncbi:cytochrome c oxidase assembly protein COX15 homolog [Orussus abietinus]|uniref:cytochrome c oxidase assembly protein COX15 homolog n=1 Tax=Orussus abietinus TaxID=222816 RepID=UPI000626784A|nr:cytochrome c oxidase assembly protein COX15 homolog [Orussus abietinus]XP_012281419.1 cytochrome c oxidase assembly protein COX15 homolog [Orussus abietinus]